LVWQQCISLAETQESEEVDIVFLVSRETMSETGWRENRTEEVLAQTYLPIFIHQKDGSSLMYLNQDTTRVIGLGHWP
jgi:hypothetical protein